MQVRYYQQHNGLLIQETSLFTNSLMGKLASILLLLGKGSLEDYKKAIHNK